MSDNELFAMTIAKLLEEAEKDGVISEDEMEIIKQVEVDADSFTLVLSEAEDDGVIDEKEASQLNELKSLIMERAETIAGLDDVISEDEMALLSKLSEILANHYRTE